MAVPRREPTLSYSNTQNPISEGPGRSAPSIPDSGPRAWQVEILPGVEVTYCVDGFVNLGVPMGTEAYVQHQLNKQLGEQAVTMRLSSRVTCGVGSALALILQRGCRDCFGRGELSLLNVQSSPWVGIHGCR